MNDFVVEVVGAFTGAYASTVVATLQFEAKIEWIKGQKQTDSKFDYRHRPRMNELRSPKIDPEDNNSKDRQTDPSKEIVKAQPPTAFGVQALRIQIIIEIESELQMYGHF